MCSNVSIQLECSEKTKTHLKWKKKAVVPLTVQIDSTINQCYQIQYKCQEARFLAKCQCPRTTASLVNCKDHYFKSWFPSRAITINFFHYSINLPIIFTINRFIVVFKKCPKFMKKAHDNFPKPKVTTIDSFNKQLSKSMIKKRKKKSPISAIVSKIISSWKIMYSS